MKHREMELKEINQKTYYVDYEIRPKEKHREDDKPGEMGRGNDGLTSDLSLTLRKKLDGIEDELKTFTTNMNDFAKTCDNELTQLLDNMDKINKSLQ